MTNTDPVRPTLAGARPTRQRLAVAEVLAAFTDFRSAQEIHDCSSGAATPSGWPRSTARCRGSPMPARWTCCGPRTARRSTGAAPTAHHHHLVCRSCGATIEVEGPAVERWTRAIAAEHGYSDVSHTLEIFGTCPACDTGA